LNLQNLHKGEEMMKKFITTFLMMAMLAMMAIALPTSADAQTRRSYRNRTTTTRVVNRPSFYRRHRNLINIGIGTGAGALLGGLIGGKRGAGWGALAGAGGSALYTYKIRPKQRRYYRAYR
jgi:hypothetical protein